MKNSETGEFELVMGNRQLLSGFFIVCLLFGVAFAMGYIVGRNSSPSARALAEMQPPAQAPVVSDARPPASGAVAQPASTPAEAPRATESQAPDAGTQPEQPPAAVTPASQPVATEAAKPAVDTPAAVISEPAPGSYWQVMAVKQTEAEVVLRTLKEKGFPTTLSPGPNNLVRVLVGPYSTRETLGKAKAELENAGFHPYLKK